MRLLALRLLALAAAVAVVLVPGWVASLDGDSSPAADPVTITDYRATFDVDEDGTLLAREELTARFPSGRHGIFRYFDLADPTDEGARLYPRDLEVERDGRPEPFDEHWESGQRFRVAQIGDANTFIAEGEHTYVLTYRVEGALVPTGADSADGSASWSSDDPDRSVFYWNVVPGGWEMPIERSTIEVRLPTAPDDVTCATGWGTALDTCAEAQVDGSTVTLTTGALEPRTPVTLRADLDVPAPDRGSLPWSVTWDYSLGRSVPLLALVLLLGAATFTGGYLWERRARERRPGYPAMFEPPPGLGPAQTAYVVEERVPDHALVATLMHQAAQGLTRLEQTEQGMVVVGLAEPAAWEAQDPVSRHVGEMLGVTTPGSRFAADGSVGAGQVLSGLKASVRTATTGWATGSGVQQHVTSEWLGRFAVIGAAVLAIALPFLGIAPLVWLVPLLAFAVGGIGLLGRGVGTRRTKQGRLLWSHAGGFRRVLTTDSAEARFDFSARQGLYTDFIPYAVVFDAADGWARKYEQETGQPAPLPDWYSPVPGLYWGAAGLSALDAAVSSFETSVSSSINAYQATQTSSSSGGGSW
ncbi:DUF2207 domain-containing protein [Aeromicrobium sp. IC_218]|uniref:DUF2207 domain-containing protein n=1 Tax=Aeromicrobium sp. IC_218 TaxID=2545468 RepID=UPI001039EE17|nr:DUF2207 domain-containing protein [Aeromicrobium sp. IC_218]TCI99913.1 DUF2207 domain-containing protein [Aeromicrobium sp. IC_218]